MLAELCYRHTTLQESDVHRIEEMAAGLGCISDLVKADIFIDCGTRDPDVAVVVAQARPSNAKSLYQGSVIGRFAHRSKEPGVMRTLDIGMPTRDLKAITQENKNVRQSVSPIKNCAGKVIGTLITEKDVTERVKVKQKLSLLARTTEQLTEELIYSRDRDESLPYLVTDGILIFNHRGLCTYANPVGESIYRKLGYMDKIEGLNFGDMTLDGVVLEDIQKKHQIIHNDVGVGNLILNIKYTLVKNKDNDLIEAVMLVNDVTDVKNKEKELVLKAVAISEIHHRVKNNLETIISLLKLQSRRIENKSIKSALNESISRVLSISVTHEILAEEGLDAVDIMNMLKRVKTSILNHGLVANKEINILIKGNTFICNSDKATSIALIVNEAMQNCFKYAFAGREKGTIAVEICNGDTYSNISIIDDGVGFVIEEKCSGNLGFNIMRRIVTEKLSGNLTIESSASGTKVFFDFPLPLGDDRI